jgi:hypothetical protein
MQEKQFMDVENTDSYADYCTDCTDSTVTTL